MVGIVANHERTAALAQFHHHLQAKNNRPKAAGIDPSHYISNWGAGSLTGQTYCLCRSSVVAFFQQPFFCPFDQVQIVRAAAEVFLSIHFDFLRVVIFIVHAGIKWLCSPDNFQILKTVFGQWQLTEYLRLVSSFVVRGGW